MGEKIRGPFCIHLCGVKIFPSSHTALYAVFVDRTRMKKQQERMSVTNEGDENFAWNLVSPIMKYIHWNPKQQIISIKRITNEIEIIRF